MKKQPAIILVLLFVGIWTSAQAQPPVDWQVQNIQQETQVWCWAAVSQQIILARVGPARTPPQCALVAMANNTPPPFCCSGFNPQCVIPGSIPQIQFLIQQFGMTYTRFAPPTDPMTLYNTLRAGNVIILQVQTGAMSNHVIVLRGMYFQPTPTGPMPMLIINDPMSHFTQPMPYQQIVPSWRSAIIVRLF